jgi:CubicO group peptidase (beta-lactamase class C family)
VDGVTKIAHYRRGFTADDHEQVWSVTKSVISTLRGVVIEEGLIKGVDQPLSTLLAEHRKAMSPDAAIVTLTTTADRGTFDLDIDSILDESVVPALGER